MNFADDYIQNVIKVGDEGSAFLAAQFARTLNNNSMVFPLSAGMHATVVARLPESHDAVVHVSGGESAETDLESYGASLVEHLVQQSKAIGAMPVGMVDVVDANNADKELLLAVSRGIADAAGHYKVAVMNGELAVLGNRVRDVNLTGVMLSMIPEGPRAITGQIEAQRNGVTYVLFNHHGRAIFMNADGVGTKTEFYERSGLYERAVLDFLAMNLDDASKKAARAIVVAGLVETSGEVPFERIQSRGRQYSLTAGVTGLFSHEPVASRLIGYAPSSPSYNLSGAVVNLIDEERLANPPKPSAGEWLVAIRGKPNPRSNGITDKRRIMVEWLGQDWHKTPEGKQYMQFLAEPSVVFYPVFRSLLESGMVSSVYHMSGGAYRGKLASPLAKEGLRIEISDMFPPDERELFLARKAGFSDEVAYAKWPMGNDGFVSTIEPDSVIRHLGLRHLEARLVGRLESALEGQRGVVIRTPQGETVQYLY